MNEIVSLFFENIQLRNVSTVIPSVGSIVGDIEGFFVGSDVGRRVGSIDGLIGFNDGPDRKKV